MTGVPLRLRVDGREAEAPAGERLRELLDRLGVRPLGLCEAGGLWPSTSCMACLIRDAASGRYLAPCGATAEAGMELETGGREVEGLRRAAVELLLSEHAGDCEAPCRRACPARIDLSPALWHLGSGEEAEAVAVFVAHAPFPAILGRVCSAPCERACRRGPAGGPVSIRGLERHLGDAFLGSLPPECRRPGPETGRRAAVVGAELAGLSAAWHLRLAGHACTLFGAGPAPGSELLAAHGPEVLPPGVVAAEAGRVLAAGVRFEAGARLGREFSALELAAQFDAVILAAAPDVAADLPAHVLPTLRPGAPAPGHARAVGLGRRAAEAAARLLQGEGGRAPVRRFDSVLRGLRPEEWSDLLASASAEDQRPLPADGYSRGEARAEARRCFRCDCRKKEMCRLRRGADAVGARQPPALTRRVARRVADHPEVLFEAGKCISCGLCLQVAEAAGEPVGLGFQGRGWDLRVAPPFGEPLSAALLQAAAACARVCPTGALSRKDRERGGTGEAPSPGPHEPAPGSS